ncbi:PAS domain-containing sensor histidine kinase [Ammoniphilus sp. YIM 78166]|uniref:PAS domain-containing sensor histidine kinase n=1 Tax=Ammoniphilus sp. YIM 78166 TaxID=1644106 RepID=UPI001431DB48|nr:PAS domain-containing sensor histidine kinase [Ammoniphilus sp. YIM 78166]
MSKERKAKLLYQEREEQLRFVVDTMPDFVCYKDAKGRWVEANPFALQLFQLEGVPYKGKTDQELAAYSDFYQEALLYCYESDQKALQSHEIIRLEEVIPKPDGSVRVFDVIKVPTFHPDGRRKGLTVIGRNITELKEAEERYKSLFEQNPEAIASYDRDGKFVSANAASQKITGYSCEELNTMDYADLVFPPDWEMVKHNFRLTLAGEQPTFEVKFRHKSGEAIDMSIKNVPIVVNGEIVGVYGIAKDITDWKRAEEWLRKSDRLSIVGELAAGVAHEIRNPLATLSGFVQLLKEQNLGHRYYYDIMSSELDRINFIVSEFMLLAKPHVLNFQPKEVGTILNHVITLANTQAILNNVVIETDIEPDLPLISCEENQLKQVFINVIKNAIEAMTDGGTLRIQAGRQEDRLFIRFIDEGPGIPEERLAKLGEPFFSTKEKGMGLGLMVSYRIIEAHGGKMNISSQVDEGTRVEVWLPLGNES